MYRVTFATLLLTAFIAAPRAAADPAKIKASIDKAIAFLKENNAVNDVPAGPPPPGGVPGFAEGPAALVGVALLEAGVPADDPAIQKIARYIRGCAVRQDRVYQLSLDIIFLDKLGEEIDTRLIQSMAARLLLSQQPTGGWDYPGGTPDEAEVRRLTAALNGAVLKGSKNLPPVGVDADKRPRLDPEVADILARRRVTIAHRPGPGDNSNTQFALIALWSARRHGVPVDGAMKLIEARFRQMQHPQGAWPYLDTDYSAPMTCAGLLGLAVTGGFRSERSMKSRGTIGADGKLDIKASKDNPPGRNPLDDPQVKRGLNYLAACLKTNRTIGGRADGEFPDLNTDRYFLWSLERVCMVFNLDRIGDIDWHAWGAAALLQSQHPNGSWMGKYNPTIETAFALMFLSRSNIVKDLTRLMKGGVGAPAAAGQPAAPEVDAEAVALTKALLGAGAAKQESLIKEYAETKGAKYTRALADAAPKLKGELQVKARDALAERMARLTAKSLEGYLDDAHPEIRRAAALGVAMREEKSLIPILINNTLDDEAEIVWRAARLALKTLTGQDFGPKPGADDAARAKAIADWQNWLRMQK